LADFDFLESETILFFSQILTPAQRKYATIVRKLFSIYVGLQKFGYLIRGLSNTLLIVTDHSNMVQFKKFNLRRKRHLTWSEEINSHPCKIYHVKGQNNGFADGFSCMLTTNKEQKNELDLQPAKFPIINTIDKEQRICNSIDKVKSIHEDKAVCHPGTKRKLELFRITQPAGKLGTLVITETIKH
jgi:RNase H-like domain found in reverse transcriptase